MKKLNDYSGQFHRSLELTDFSAETLAGLLRLYSRFYSAVDGFWYLALKERLGNDEALACDLWVWDRLTKYEMKHITKLLNIQGDDVTAMVKAIQLSPWFWQTESTIEIENHRSAIFTVTRCSVLDYMEKESEGREHQICHIVEPKVLKSYASYFNPAIEVECLKIPPRDKKEGLCCQWRFTLE